MKKLGFIFDRLFFIGIYIYIIIAQIYSIYNIYLNAILLLIVNFYLIVKCRKNILLFYLFIAIFYFNYSIVITKYVKDVAPILESVYYQIPELQIRYIAINSLLIFINTIGFILGDIKPVNITNKIWVLNKEYKYK